MFIYFIYCFQSIVIYIHFNYFTLVAFRRVFESQQSTARQHREELENLLSADALNPAVQERIAELIKSVGIVSLF